MYPVTIEWVPAKYGGRQQPPPVGLYYAVSRFDIVQNESWSVVFQLEINLINSHQQWFTQGKVRFLFENAPTDYFDQSFSFKIYEGPHFVANVFLR
ncbi:hypothetical protein MASR2M36_19230 [Providencia sp.]